MRRAQWLTALLYEFSAGKATEIIRNVKSFVMKLTKSEKCAILICAVFLSLSLGFALGQQKQEPVFVVTESSFTAEREPEGIADGGAAQNRLNINLATAVELETLEGVGPVLAERIIAYRESEGEFKKIEDITKVRGIGASVFEDIRDHICVD